MTPDVDLQQNRANGANADPGPNGERPLALGEPDPFDVSGRVDWSTFWHRDRTAADWLAEPLLANGRSHSIYATAKAGKSLLMLSVAVSLATGRSVLRQEAGEPKNVLYLDYEMTEDDLYERLSDMGYGPDDDLSHFHYYLLPSLPPLDTPEGGKVVAALALYHQADLVVVDTMGRAVEGEENTSDTYRDFYRYTGSELKRLGITVVRLDHAGKDASRGQRGSSSKNDDVDIVWRLTPSDDGLRLKATHRRVGWVPEDVGLHRHTDPLRFTPTARAWQTGTADLARRLDELGVPLEAGRPTAREALRAANLTASNQLLIDALAYRRDQSKAGQ